MEGRSLKETLGDEDFLVMKETYGGCLPNGGGFNTSYELYLREITLTNLVFYKNCFSQFLYLPM